MACVDGEAVRDVGMRVRDGGEAPALFRRSGGRAWRLPRKAAPAAPSGPVTTSMSPGIAPARPGTRSERPIAVTASTSCGALGRVAAGDRDAGLVQALVQLDHVVQLELGGSGERDEQRQRARRRRRRGRSG